ncbi:MAG: PEGA domain-containing protein [Spirochaetia bacterium]|nr:PEGA domain-containing protein [Spirochaetia bacterium]
MVRKLSLLLFILIPLFAFGVEDKVLRDPSSGWNILVTDLICNSPQEDAPYISKTLSSAVYRHLSVIKKHRMSDEEIAARREAIKAEYVDECQKALSKSYQEYDALLFKDKDLNKKINLKSTISKDKRMLRKANRKKLEKIYVQRDRDIVFLNDAEDKDTSIKGPIELATRAKKDNLDYIVWGSMKMVEDVVVADISLYSAMFKKDLSSIRITGDLETIYQELDKRLDAFYSDMLGKPWAKINVAVNDEDVDVFVDGNFVSAGSLSNIILEPGEHIVLAAGNNKTEEFKQIMLEENQSADIDFRVEPVESKLFAISSFPSGADVYYNSVWQGQTPMILNGAKGEVVISKEGYQNSRVFLEEINGNTLDFFPQKEVFNKDDYLLDKRNDFYKNLTWFVLSIPVAFFTYANYLAYDDLHDRAKGTGDSHEIHRTQRIKTYSQYGYYGALFLSVTLFTNAMFYLKDYIIAGQSYNNDRRKK